MDEEALERELTAGEVAEAEPDTMPCPVCREDIKKGALKCVECSSDLRGWRRYASLGSTNLALLTALVSVVGSSLPAIRTALMPQDAQIEAVPITIAKSATDNTSHLTILVSNSGRKLGVIRIIGVQLLGKGELYMGAPGSQVFEVPASSSKVIDVNMTSAHAEIRSTYVPGPAPGPPKGQNPVPVPDPHDAIQREFLHAAGGLRLECALLTETEDVRGYKYAKHAGESGVAEGGQGETFCYELRNFIMRGIFPSAPWMNR